MPATVHVPRPGECRMSRTLPMDGSGHLTRRTDDAHYVRLVQPGTAVRLATTSRALLSVCVVSGIRRDNRRRDDHRRLDRGCVVTRLDFACDIMPRVLSGIKSTTIRLTDKGLVAGDKVELCGDGHTMAATVVSVAPVIITRDMFHTIRVAVNNRQLTPYETRWFAKREGFSGIVELVERITKLPDYRLPINGFLITWKECT